MPRKTNIGPVDDDIFSTPPIVAKELVQHALKDFRLVSNTRCLDPSAGSGVIIKALKEATGLRGIVAVETDFGYFESLEALCGRVYMGDFRSDDLQRRLRQDYPWFDIIVASPPFLRGEAMSHILKMYEILAGQGRLVAWIPEVSLEATDKATVQVKALIAERGYQFELSAGVAFPCSTVIVINKPAVGLQ